MNEYNILAIDDEVNNLDALRRTFNTEYNVLSATNGNDALAIMEERNIALILADHHMPGMTGIELMEKTSRDYPDTTRIIITGYSDENLLMDAINTGHVYGFITKPWETEEIITIVKKGIEVYEKNCIYGKLHIRALLHSGVISNEQLESCIEIYISERKSIGEILVERDLISRSQLNTAMKIRESKREKLEEVLIRLGSISQADLEMVDEWQKFTERSLLKIIVDMGYTDEQSILSCYALQLGIPIVSLAQFSAKQELVKLLPPRIVYKYSIVPIDMAGKVLILAASEPLTNEEKSEIEENVEYKVMIVCATFSDIETAVKQQYNLV